MAHQQLWLLRHGEAVPHESKPDFERELTARGERQAAAAGEALARLGLELDACYTSPLVRARDTAKLACEPLSVSPEERDALGKDFDELESLALSDLPGS
jgi:phosphohistidine phosphatase